MIELEIRMRGVGREPFDRLHLNPACALGQDRQMLCDANSASNDLSVTSHSFPMRFVRTSASKRVRKVEMTDRFVPADSGYITGMQPALLGCRSTQI